MICNKDCRDCIHKIFPDHDKHQQQSVCSSDFYIIMPLVNVFAATPISDAELRKLHDHLLRLFGVEKGILQINVVATTKSYPVDTSRGCFVSIRCKGKADRTPEKMLDNIKKLGAYLVREKMFGAERGGGKVRLETFEPKLQVAAGFGGGAKL